MKIDRSRVRKSTSEVPLECQQLIERLQQCSRTELLDELSRIHSWTFGKCELLHWAQVLDIFDKILGEAAERNPDNKWILKCDTYNESELNLLLCILRFTSLLIEHSFSRHLYNSMEHLLVLQESNEMSVVLEVLNLLYMFSKRSNFITRLKTDEKDCLLVRLSCLAESWGGKESGFGLADCCNPDKDIPSSATTLHVEFQPEEDSKSSKTTKKDTRSAGKPSVIHIEHVDKLHKTPAEIMKSLVSLYYVPPEREVRLFTHVRLATHFNDYDSRLKMVQARLQALSVIVYSNAIQEVSSNLLYNGLLEELVEVVELQDIHLSDIRCAALRTLTAIIHLDRGPHLNRRPAASRLNNIIDVTGASLYHGFLPALVRNCISSLTNQVDCGQSAFKKMKLQDSISESDEFNNTGPSENSTNIDDSPVDADMEFTPQRVVAQAGVDSKYPVSLTTALFSFLYHLASYQSGGEALVSCGMMESLLQVINWQGFELDHINFVTRAVRVIDLITNIDMTAFQTYGGLYSFISRLDIEVNFCKKDQLYRVTIHNVDQLIEETSNSDNSSVAVPSTSGSSAIVASSSASTDKEMEEDTPSVANADVEYVAENVGKSCLPQRAALLKSMLNFLKKAFNDATFAESIRHLMEGTLPNSLKNIIANAEYYGASLFLLATDVVTVYVYQEPSLLSALQDNGLTDIILYALLVKEVPATREVLGSLPNVFSALCLNNRGLEAFAKYNPFEKLFNILLSPNYLPAMRRRRSSEPTNDTASVLGNAMDELMRHQPSLRQDATMAIITLLEELEYMGTDPKFVCWRPHSKSDVLPPSNSRSTNNAEGSSDEEEDDEEEASTSSQNAQSERIENQPQPNSERQPIALIDYILNAMKFIDSILSNNSTDDHCREFCDKGGIIPLLRILGLPNLPVDCPVTNPAQAVATVCKSILNLAHEPFLFSQGLTQLAAVLENLKPLYAKTQVPGASKLLLELVSCPDLETAFSTASATPLLHAMNAAHGYVIMFVHICRTGQTDIRNLSLQHWGSQEGLAVLQGLSELYTSLVWESTLLLAYCSDDLLPSDCDFRREDIEKLNAFFDKYEGSSPTTSGTTSDNNTPAATTPGTSGPSGGVNSAGLDPLTANYAMDLDSEITINKDSRNLKIIRPLLGASSRLGRALAELFGLLVKLCVGPPIRQRRGQNIISAPPIPSVYATNVATALNKLLVEGLDCEKLPPCPNPKCRLTFLICSIGFTSPMLFDERRYPYHLMLKKFISLGGQSILFKTFQWALMIKANSTPDTIDYATLPEGTFGFLDAWLTLIEKLVNPKTVIESPHVISNRSGSSFGFDPFSYLKKIHRQAFENVKLLWRKKRAPYGERTTETLLTIMRHIFRGDKIIKEKMKSEENKTEGASTSTAGPSTEPAGLRQLVDMGFSRESALEALQHTNSIEHATEYLLSNPSHMSRSTNSMDVGLEEDQVQQAIAISLENSGASTNEGVKPTQEELEKQFEAAINEFATNALEDFLNILDELPDTVHKVCDLLVTLMKRNPVDYSEKVFDTLIEEMMKIIHYLSYYVFNNSISIVNYYSVVLSETPQRLHSILHLFILLFESPFCSYMKGKCGMKLYKKRTTTIAITLITRVVDMMMQLRAVQEPKWIAPALLFIDLLAKADICHTRKMYMHLTTTRVWRWYDLVTGRWTQYSNNNNRLINEAYWSGEPSIRVTCGRKRYTVTFANMLQINDETGNNRPIAMTLATFTHPSCTDINGQYMAEPLYTDLTHREENRALPIVGSTTFEQKMMLIKATCELLALPTIDKNILHSALQLSARLTRDHEMAKVFVKNGGIKSLLALRQINDFPGFGILATILIRHTLEEPNTLQYSMEKIIRGRTLSTIPPPYKDLVYLVRQISGAVARHPYIFWYVASEILRVDITNYKGEPPEVSLPVKVEPPSRTKAPPLEDACSFEVISELLKALLDPLEDKNVGDHEKSVESTQLKSKPNQTDATKDTGNTEAVKLPEIAVAQIPVTTSNASSQTGDGTTTNASSQTGDGNPETKGETLSTSKSDEGAKIEEDNRSPEEKERSGYKNPSKKPMLPKSVILKILADAVVSYGPIAKLITDYKYKASDSEFLSEDTTALAFVFDKILPTNPLISDSDCSTMCRMLIAALASSNHSPEAQIALVSEVKLALMRSLMMPESTEKHNQIQNICGIITTMIENCPLPHSNRWSTCVVNNIVKLMIKRGVFSDLAKIMHYLDLSSPHTSFTANEALKPLEALSRTINQPGPSGNQSKSRKSNQTNEDNTEPPTSSTEQTNAQGEELEDTENTERDISAVASSLENNSVSTGRIDNTLEEMMQHILQHRSDNSQGYNDVQSSRNTTMDIDEECTIDYDQERDATEELMSTDSGESDSNPSDQVDDDGNDDNDGDDDNLDDNDDNDDNNYYDDDNDRRRRGGAMFRLTANDRDEDILMIQYETETNNAIPSMIRWNENGFAILDQPPTTTEHTGTITHPLLVSRNSFESSQNSSTRNQRTNRTRRYQYLYSPRTPNPPVILQRLLGPDDPHLANVLSANNLLNGPELRENARVVVMDNFGIIPSNEEQIDFVDQSGYLFGPSLAATLSHIPPVLHWWNIESKLLDVESTNDAVMFVCNKLIPVLINMRNEELRNKKSKEKDEAAKKAKQKSANPETNPESTPDTVVVNDDESTNTSAPNDANKQDEMQNQMVDDRRVGVELISEDLDSSFTMENPSQEDLANSCMDDGAGPSQRRSARPPNRLTETRVVLLFEEMVYPRIGRRGELEIEFMPHSDQQVEIIDGDHNKNVNGRSSDDVIPPIESDDNVVPPIESDDNVIPPIESDDDVILIEGDVPEVIEINDDVTEVIEINDDVTGVIEIDDDVTEVIEIEDEKVENDVIEIVDDSDEEGPLAKRDEELNGEPVEISDTSNESSQDSDVLITRLPSFLRGNENSQTTEVTQNASVQTIGSSESVTRLFNNRTETSETDLRGLSNPFEMSLTAYVRSRNNAFGRPITSPPMTFQQFEQIFEPDNEPPPGLDVQLHNNPLRTLFEEAIMQQAAESAAEQQQPTPQPQQANQSVEAPVESTPPEQREPEPEAPPATPQENSNNATEANAPAAADVVVAGPSSSNDDEEIPEGVDPSFLEALPPEIRREVLEQHRILCIQQRYRAAQESGEEYILSTPQVSPDFLAALPPSLQEEVLSQHRIELQRQAAARANPDEPVDAASFFETLQPSLRTMILSDMEDSQMSALPPDLAQEAQNLRRDWYARNRQIAQERFLQTNLSAIYRHSRGRQSLRQNNFHRGGWGHWSRDFVPNSAVTNNQVKIRGRQLLDHEGIACLLILLFTDDSHLNKLRLHRVIRNLCYHAPTREWVINSLLSIIEKSVNVQSEESFNKPTRKGPKPGPLTSKLLTDTKHLQNGGHWLTIRMEAALGCAANVFILNKATGKKCDKSSGANTISIHPQAAPIVCKNTLDLLTSLAKAFPSCLIPIKTGREDVDKNLTPVKIKADSSDFWDVLIRLDSSTKKGKSIQKQSTSSSTLSDSDTTITFEQTAFGKLLNMLASPVVKRNTQLTDNLLKLLSVTTSGMPDLSKPHKSGRGKSVVSEIMNKPPTNALNLVVNVITYQNCSEEGLEFITNLLLNLAHYSLDMSFLILNLLLNGAVEIGSMVEQQIQDMLRDLRELLGTTQKRKLEEAGGSSSSKGVIYNRFTNEQVIVTASSKVKSACELQLPSMIPLTSKSSGQVFFLRVLRVIVQIRNSIKQSMKKADSSFYDLLALSEQLTSLNSLWDSLSMCLFELEHAPDHHAVLVLQPTVEAFFLVHSPQQGAAKPEKKEKEKDEEESTQAGSESESSTASRKVSKASTEGSEPREGVVETEKPSDSASTKSTVPPEQHFLAFAEKHRTVLNQILRQSTAHLADGPFAVLVDHTRILDFDIKRRYFRTELERMDDGVRREETAVHVRRSNIFEDSFRELFRRPPEEWKNRFYIVFEDEEGQDAGGLLREWYVIISRDIFNPMYALFTVSPGDRVTYMINSASHYNSNHLCYYKFVGRVIAKAIYDNKLLECYFTRSFYKHILGIPVKYTDMESEDYSFYRGLVYLMENNISNMDIDLTFSTEISEFGVTETRDLIPNGRHIAVTEENKMEYIRLVCQMKMTGAIKQQLNSFLEGFYDIIPMRLISIFNEQELELLISGLPNVDIEDLKMNTEYHKYQSNSLQIQWFWRALRSFDQADRAKFLQFVTGTSKVPLQGFGALEGMNGVQKFQIHRDDRSTDRLPSAHTCFNQLDLPVYETYDKLRSYLLKAIHECSEGFGFA